MGYLSAVSMMRGSDGLSGNYSGSLEIGCTESAPSARSTRPWIDEVERLRRLVPIDPDRCLKNWADWQQGYRMTRGLPDHATGINTGTRCASADSGDHIYEATLGSQARICDVIIRELTVRHRSAIEHVYTGLAVTMRDLDGTLVEAAAIFWERAQRRGVA